ncbi:MAG: hypothetical protein CMF39_06170 [Legionellaceae bacterium]|nr:hypothetical protein [Legionellaceae bacterium]|tara:strand:+ start:165 stop:512 length:348 start_codon:yes stop_codon:yes gene_type:complete
MAIYNKYVDEKINKLLESLVGFDWNKGNANKNWHRHGVTLIECEQVFFNQPLLLGDDDRHSVSEKRYYALGITNLERRLFIAFTIRSKLIRVISARDMSKKERKVYEKHEVFAEV